MKLSINRPATIALLVAAAISPLALAACGDDDDDSSASATESGPVAVESIDGTVVLVDSAGQALYSTPQEAGGEIACRGDCLSVWEPLTASAGELDDAGDLSADLGTVERPDGDEQVTYKGMPLYTFGEEGPGELTGNGLVDDFQGQTFEWEAAITDASTDATEPPAPSSSGGY